MHAVRDDHRVAAEVLDLQPAGDVGDRDPAGDLLQPRPQTVPKPPATATGSSRRGRWRRSGPSAIMQASSDRLGGAGSCTCTHVEVALAQPAADPGGRHRAELQPGHRAVVRDRHGPAGRRPRSSAARRLLVLGRGEHRHVVAEREQRLGEVADVGLHAAGDVPRVGQTSPILIGRPPRGRASRPAAAGRPATAAAACASRPGAGDRRGERVGERLGGGGDPVAQPARRRHRHLGVDRRAASRRAVNQVRPGAAWRRSSRPAAPGRPGIGSARRRTSTGDAAAGQVAVGEQARPTAVAAAARAAPSSSAARRRSAAAISHAQRLAVGDEAVGTATPGLQPLGDGA